jgi:hypothetical protein
MARKKGSKTANHLVVFVHGHNGHPSDLTYVSTQLQQKNPERVISYLTTSFEGKTSIGVDIMGHSVANEVQEYLETLSKQDFVIKYISFVGHSLGGLVSRYAIGVLYAAKLFDTIRPINFTTFATPHVGIRKPLTGFTIETVHNSIFNFVASSYVTGKTGAQLSFEDNHESKGRPLLVAMTEEGSDYMRALRSFRYKSLYANVAHDYLVPYYTAAISFSDFSTDVYPYVTDYEPVVFDMKNRTPSNGSGGTSTSTAKQLKLLNSQISMIKVLNGLGWVRYPVHIHNYWNTHTAILMFKVQNEDTCEGKVVVCHFKDHFVVRDDD